MATYVVVALFALAKMHKIGTALAWLGNMGYLLGAYSIYATENYDIDWTMAQCVLCLRLIGFAVSWSRTKKKEKRKQGEERKGRRNDEGKTQGKNEG